MLKRFQEDSCYLSYLLHNQTFLLLAYGTYMYVGKVIHFHDNIPRLRDTL